VTGRAADGGLVTTLTALSRRLQAAFPRARGGPVGSRGLGTATLIGVDTVEMIERLAWEYLASQRRRAQLAGAQRWEDGGGRAHEASAPR